MQKATSQASYRPETGQTTAIRHFLDIGDLDTATLKSILYNAHRMKADRANGSAPILPGAVLAMIFEKPSTRTRVSFEVAIHELGGRAVVLNPSEMQLGRGETIADTAKVLSRYCDAIMLRTGPHRTLLELAENAGVPVINGLTAQTHPCQIMADIMTFQEHKGAIEGATIAWVGDANNVAASWIHAAARFGFSLRIAAPAEYPPAEELAAFARSENADISVTEDPAEAVAGADCIVTDVWVSMGDADAEQRMKVLRPYQVNAALMEKAKPDAIFMHCLPAHRDDEVTAEVIDGPQSVVWDEAENRLHAQKAILAWCLESKSKQLGD